METRFAAELRADGRTLTGHAAVWDTPAQIGGAGGFVESIRRGAFSRTLADGEDVACLIDHDASRLVGRTSSGTLQLREDDRGLAFTVALPKTTLADDLLELAGRGDLGGCSIGFTVPPGGDAWPAPGRRELRSVSLAEISVVHFRPAYAGTSVAVRMSVRAARLRLALL